MTTPTVINDQRIVRLREWDEAHAAHNPGAYQRIIDAHYASAEKADEARLGAAYMRRQAYIGPQEATR